MGGTERIVSYLTEELVAQGHDVTLFASGDSVTDARLVDCRTSARRGRPSIRSHALPRHGQPQRHSSCCNRAWASTSIRMPCMSALTSRNCLLDEVTLRRLQIGNSAADVTVRRSGPHVVVDVVDRRGDIRVLTMA